MVTCSLLQAAEALLDAPTLVKRWETALVRWQRQCLPALPALEALDGLALLWKEYILLQASLFATYSYTTCQASERDGGTVRFSPLRPFSPCTRCAAPTAHLAVVQLADG